MTHLEILARRLDKRAQEATRFSAWHSNGGGVDLESYYRGKSAGFCLAADMLRWEALERAKIDKEARE